VRTKARDLMAERETPKQLDITDPNVTWDDLLKKYGGEGKSMDDVYSDILGSAKRSRTSVNKALGLED